MHQNLGNAPNNNNYASINAIWRMIIDEVCFSYNSLSPEATASDIDEKLIDFKQNK